MNLSIKLYIPIYLSIMKMVFGNMIWELYIVSKNFKLTELMLVVMTMFQLVQFKYKLFIHLVLIGWVVVTKKFNKKH